MPVLAELPGVQSVERALRLLATVGRETPRGIGLSALVAESGLNKPTVRRLLIALMRAGLVEQDPATRLYFLGEEAFVLGLRAARRHGLLERTMPSLRRLCAATLDTSFLTVRRDNHAVCLHREEGTFPVRTHALQTGDQHPLGIGAGSLAILAGLSDPEIESVLRANESALAERYPACTRAIIEADIAATRAQGYALNPGRIVASSWGIGMAFRYPDGRIAGALSIAAIDSRMLPERQPELARHLAAEVRVLEDALRTLFDRQRDPAAPITAAPRRMTR